MFHGDLDNFQKPSLGGRPKPRDHGIPNTHNSWFILFYHVWGPTWIKIHWYSIWLRTRSHMTSHNTWGSVTTLHDFESILGRPLDAFFWALTISWSWLLARVWSGPKSSWRLSTNTLNISSRTKVAQNEIITHIKFLEKILTLAHGICLFHMLCGWNSNKNPYIL